MAWPIFVSAFLFYLSFPNLFFLKGVSFLAWIFAIPFFANLEHKNLICRLQAGFLWGLITNLAAVNWMIPYSLPGYFLLATALASQAIIFAALYPSGKVQRVGQIFYVPCLWVACEYLRKLLMFGQSWDLGHSQSFDIPLLQLAGVFGSGGISFFLIFVNYGLYLAAFRFKENSRRIAAIILVVFLASGVYAYGWFVLKNPNPVSQADVFKIAVVQPNINYQLKLSDEQIEKIADQLIALSRQGLKQSSPDLVVWPETAIPTDFLDQTRLKSKILALVKESGVPFLIGAAIEDDSGVHNSAVFVSPDGRVTEIYHKRHLIPLTEFIPSSWFWETVAQVFHVESPELVPGTSLGLMQITSSTTGQKVSLGVAICSEDNIAQVFEQYRKQGTGFVVVLLNNGWFSQKEGLVMHAEHSIVHAVENSMPLVRAANTGLSGGIDSQGRLSAHSLDLLQEKEFFIYKIFRAQNNPAGQNLMNTFCVLCWAFVIMFQIYGLFKRQKAKGRK